ncbi:C45 family autoproteolytic acyltransferase/hydrolase [Streptomyces sp. NPDC059853]|uniref:C45 family autoproteolytic acyltransferase/hydolase n=1 Tax=Streptomyces sp. NPDC059853 TaxID=3346973 RepID=UPI00364ED83F
MEKTLRKTFRTVDVGSGDDARWAGLIRETYPPGALAGWLTDTGRTDEGARAARRLFETHLPELVPALDRLGGRLADIPHAGTLLTLAAVRPFFAGCTQTGAGGELLRNYDFDPDEAEGSIVRSQLLRPVIGTQEGGWGLLDGMNDAGLAISLTFGGRKVHGPGFAVVIVIRYLLETCTTVDEALARLRTLPIAIPQNLTLVDRHRSVTVHLGPDIPLTEAPDACAANHQSEPVPPEQERATRTGERLAAIRAAGPEVAAMLRPPLYQLGYDRGLGTVYTAHYRPAEGTVTYHWPAAESWSVSFDTFTEETRTVRLGAV